MSKKALTPIEQKEVTFYDDLLTAVLVEKEDTQIIYVPIRPICNFLGVAWDPQRRRINRDPVLSEEAKGVTVMVTPSSVDGRGGGPQEMICLPLKFIPGFLFGIQVSRVKEDLRDKIIRYQRECYDVLAEAFTEGRLTGESTFHELLDSDSEAVQAYKILQAMVKLARNQVLIEARIDAQDNRLDFHGEQLQEHVEQFQEYGQRIEELEATLGDPKHQVTPSQAMQISQAVKAVALEMSKQTKRNEYGGVYGELYRRFEITSYKLLPANKFEEAMDWLREWYGSLVGEAPF